MIVYSTSLEIRPVSPIGLEDSATRTQELVRSWVIAWYSRRGSVTFTVPERDGRVRPIEGHEIQVRSRRDGSSRELWTVTWTRPDEADATLKWQASAMVARDREHVEFTVLLRVDSSEFEVRPIRVSLRPPRIVQSIVAELTCRLGTRPLRSEPVAIDAASVSRFVTSELRDPERRLPCIVVSTKNADGSTIVNPALLAQYVAGLAEVYVLQDKWTSYELRSEVSQNYACYDGAVRVYWPRFGSKDDLAYHPYFTEEGLQGLPGQRDAGELRVFRMVAQRAASRATPGSLARAIEQATLADARQAQDSAIQELQERAARGETDVKALSDKLREVIVTRDEALRLLEEERSRREELERQIALTGVAESPEPQSQPGLALPASVGEAILQAERRFGAELVITDDARRSAAESPFRSPDRVLSALEAIAELSKIHFSKTPFGSGIGPLETFFRSRGALDYASQDSVTTTGKYGQQRRIIYHGEPLMLSRHLTLGGGSRENCLQIYWELDSATKKIVIGHCGLHLDYARHNT